MKRVVSLTATLTLALTFALAGCSTSPTAPANAPEGHTILKSGVPHAPGLTNPTENCTTCHGATLQGGTAGQPSCYSCHGRKW